MITWGIYIVRFFVVILIQGLIVNNIHLGLGDLVNISIYPLFILMLPFETSFVVLLISSFLLGISVDSFTNTIGLNASAAVLTAYLRPKILTIMAPRDGYEFGMLPNVKHMGIRWFATYTSILILIHHIWLFSLEELSFNSISHLLLKTIVSTFFSVLTITIAQFLTLKPKK